MSAPAKPDFAQIGQRLVELRGRRSQREFSKEMGVDLRTLGNYERGERLPPLDFLIRLKEATGVSIDSIATGHSAPGTHDLDVGLLHEVVRAVQDEVPEIDALAKAKLISRLYKDRILALSKENEASAADRGKAAS